MEEMAQDIRRDERLFLDIQQALARYANSDVEEGTLADALEAVQQRLNAGREVQQTSARQIDQISALDPRSEHLWHRISTIRDMAQPAYNQWEHACWNARNVLPEAMQMLDRCRQRFAELSRPEDPSLVQQLAAKRREYDRRQEYATTQGNDHLRLDSRFKSLVLSELLDNGSVSYDQLYEDLKHDEVGYLQNAYGVVRAYLSGDAGRVEGGTGLKAADTQQQSPPPEEATIKDATIEE